ncbi:hypothetical protein M426DRAFT_11562 [Hypoxylon sp. CI-4A]|nr:hypothetical protein M426DRAFT_11562 [Hypoxylon sp. CI-4A]
MVPATTKEKWKGAGEISDTKKPLVEDILRVDVPYLDAACEEGFRFRVAKASPRQAIADTEILGCKIPEGTEMFMNYHINRDPTPVEEPKLNPSSQAAAAKFEDR